MAAQKRCQCQTWFDAGLDRLPIDGEGDRDIGHAASPLFWEEAESSARSNSPPRRALRYAAGAWRSSRGMTASFNAETASAITAVVIGRFSKTVSTSRTRIR